MELEKLNRLLKSLTMYSIKSGLCNIEDYQYMINQLLDLFNLDEYKESEIEEIDISSATKYTEPLIELAVSKNIIKDSIKARDGFEAKMMNIFLPSPSIVSERFGSLYKQSITKSTDYLYNISNKSNYIKGDRVKKNVTWKAESAYGTLDMTINISKPEKSAEEIKNATKVVSNYPLCPLCLENVGLADGPNRPARNNLRAVPVTLADEQFYLQYSPYVYYNEHSICFKETHEPMVISSTTFRRLLDFVEQFPHYFLGSNADLPIVGGSILSHEHYQGGAFEFPLQRAKSVFEETIDNCVLRRLHWPVTVIQLEGSKEDVIKLAGKILGVWQTFDLKDANIISKTDKQHNTITPIARMNGDLFQIDLALRNNRTSEDYPEGIFHSHPEYHHIKRENLGLIEVLGLSVLPARLVKELGDVASYLNGSSIDLGEHSKWANALHLEDDLESYLQAEVGKIFVKCLENAGVFKNDEPGNQAFEFFIDTLKN